MNNKKINALLPLTIALALLFGIIIGMKFNNNDSAVFRGMKIFKSPNKITQTLDFIKTSYVDTISGTRLEEDAIKGMLKNLDPHSQYIPASDFSAINDPLEGSFSGIGVQFNKLYDTVVIVNTIPKGPSEKVGIMSGDRMIYVDGMPIAGVGMSTDDIVKKLKGETGTTVNVGILRRGNDEILNFAITRDRIPLFSIDAAYIIAPTIGYIKVGKFSKTTFQEFTEATDKLIAEGMQKLIIDLRDNPGGLIDGAVKMAEIFLPAESLIVYTEGDKRSRINYYSKNHKALDIKLVLLINENSASASEIVAGAIQDNDRGTVIGRRSYGKGLVQEQHPLIDGSVVRITVSRYYTPTGRCIQKPYNSNNLNDYFNEIDMRFVNGEMVQEDSVHFDNKLLYLTPAGKIVYGGGGIMPDIFVPIDTTIFTNYYKRVRGRGLSYYFALDYIDKNRQELNSIEDYKSMEKYLLHHKILDQFIEFAAKVGLPKNNNDLKFSGEQIENLLMAYIARNILDDNRGYYPVLNQKDNVVQKAVQELGIEN